MATKYTATFSDGTAITRTSERTYGAAWRATWTDPRDGEPHALTGFCASPEKASPYSPCPYGGALTGSRRAQQNRKNAEFRAAAGYRVEIVPAQSN